MKFSKLNKKIFMYANSEKYIAKRLSDNTDINPPPEMIQAITTGVSAKRFLSILVPLVGFVGLLFYLSQVYQPKDQAVSPPLLNQTLIQEVYADLSNLANPTLMAHLFSPTFRYHITDGETTLHGLEELQGLFETHRSVHPVGQTAYESIIEVNELVVTRWTKMMISNAAYDKDTDVRSADPKLVKGTTIWHISDGKIIEAWIILD